MTMTKTTWVILGVIVAALVAYYFYSKANGTAFLAPLTGSPASPGSATGAKNNAPASLITSQGIPSTQSIRPIEGDAP